MSSLYALICSALFVSFYAYHKHTSAREFILLYTGAIIVQFLFLKYVFDMYLTLGN